MFDGVINALAGMEDKTLQAAYANEIFGDKIANQMLPFLNAGAEEIAKFKDEFNSIGALSTEQVKALAELDDTIYLLKESFKNVGAQIGASFAPLLKSLADSLQNNLIPKLQQLAEWFNSLSLSQQEMIAKALLMVAALAPVLAIVGKLTSGVGNIIGLLPKLGSALSTLAANPIILIISAIAAILVVLYTQCEQFRESINNLVGMIAGALQPILEVIMSVLSTLMNMITPILNIL
ncbi:MAG: phage tail tape measure protein, partial [Clostridia bacterium]|nr:phage tail tape measure protein [Clostridia bacterium]